MPVGGIVADEIVASTSLRLQRLAGGVGIGVRQNQANHGAARGSGRVGFAAPWALGIDTDGGVVTGQKNRIAGAARQKFYPRIALSLIALEAERQLSVCLGPMGPNH